MVDMLLRAAIAGVLCAWLGCAMVTAGEPAGLPEVKSDRGVYTEPPLPKLPEAGETLPQVYEVGPPIPIVQRLKGSQLPSLSAEALHRHAGLTDLIRHEFQGHLRFDVQGVQANGLVRLCFCAVAQ